MDDVVKQHIAKVMARWIHTSKFRRRIVKLAAPDLVSKLNDFEKWLDVK